MNSNLKPTSYVTTSIPYVNARPHLGFALELCIADAFARHRRARGRDVRFVTGTDDHSLKNVLAAERAGVPTARWVAEHAAAFESLSTALGISFDDFVRTSTSTSHTLAVQALWRACDARGDLFRQVYRGWYCVGCERFFEPGELADARCPDHDTPLEQVEEENWFFRLSRYREVLLDAIETGRLRIEHDGAREETLSFLHGPVRDISVSRSTVRARGWGLNVPGDPSQVIWVWFDALAYYLAALGYGGDDARFASYWENSVERVHVIGKGIARFHAVFWPAFLASAGLPWPSDLLVHGYLTLDGAKISKSGRTLDPEPLIERFGADAVRYYLLRHIRTARDGDFRIQQFVAAYNADLANGLGNLTSRVVALVQRANGGFVPAPGPESSEDRALREQALALAAEVDAGVDRLALDEAVGAVFRLVEAANRHVARTAPWELIRSGDTERAASVLRTSLETLRVIADEIEPFLPATAKTLRVRIGAQGADPTARWDALCTGEPLCPGPALFPRVNYPD